jgi:hypothetical protein
MHRAFIGHVKERGHDAGEQVFRKHCVGSVLSGPDIFSAVSLTLGKALIEVADVPQRKRTRL